MPKKRRRSRRKSEAAIRRGLVAALAIAVALAGAVTWLRTDDGRMAMADRGLAAGEEWARDHLHGVILEAVGAREVPADSIVVETAPVTGPALVRLGLRPEASLTALNLALTAAVEEAGGTVHYGRRTSDDDGAQLELRFGTRVTLTHRVLARRGTVPPPPEELETARLAIVIDDLGHNVNGLTRRALGLPGPITFAVLPELRYSARLLTEVRRAGHSALLHLPMEAEPDTGYDAGEPQIRVGMDARAIRRTVERCLDGLPDVVGVNNHMGSRVTPSRPEMDAVMAVLAERGLVFLDSQTSSRSVAHVAAADAGVPHVRNDIFLDAGGADVELVVERLRFLLRRAHDRGWAVGIGHVNEATVDGLERILPELEAEGVALVPIAELIHDLAS
jgi:hypothetical protein